MIDHTLQEPSKTPRDLGKTLPGPTILVAGLGVGFATDQLMRGSQGPGLNFFLLFVCLATSVVIVARTVETPLSREAVSWLGIGLLCGAALMWRASGLLRFGTFLAGCTAFALVARDPGREWLRRAGVRDMVEAVVGAAVQAAFASVRLIRSDNWNGDESDTSRGAALSVARTVAIGGLLALVPLTVFGTLFISADKMFASIVGDFVLIDLQTLASHVVVIAIVGWITCGYLVRVAVGMRRPHTSPLYPPSPSLGIGEVATALGLVDLLFLGFVSVQFRYLFGGGSWVQVTPDLTYAVYARAGFFQLVVAVGLAIPWLLTAHSLIGDGTWKARSVFRAFAGVHVLLLLVVVASAIQRMLVYQTAYGLTEERVIATAGLLWLTGIVVWFGATVLSGNRNRFAFGALVSAFVLVGTLQLINPAGLVASHNLDRTEEFGGVDVEYLAYLNGDAVPLLLARLHEFSIGEQCLVAEGLLGKWGPEQPGNWRSFNWSESRARREVGGALRTLRALVGAEECGTKDPGPVVGPDTREP